MTAGLGRKSLWPAAGVLILLLTAACALKPSSVVKSPSTKPSSPSPSPSPVHDEPALAKIGAFQGPIYVASPPADPRLFVVERAGRIWIMKNGQRSAAPFLDIVPKVSSGGERGLFSVAFAPDYATSGLSYVDYTDRNGDTRVVEYHASSDPDRADLNSAREILFVKQPFANHNGGQVTFDPTGALIVGLGDGGSAGDPGNRAQNLGELLGKLLRIDPRHPSDGRPYGIPAGNPFTNRPGARPEIWTYGMRNPWRFTFDQTGNLYVGDVGQNRFEEIDFVPPARQSGANFGWRRYEGDALFRDQKIDETNLIHPALTYSLGGGHCAVTGGPVYRGEVNTLRGRYLYADVCEGVVKSLVIADGKATDLQTHSQLATSQLVSFGEDSSGEAYVVSLAGDVFKIVRKT
jgi:glucose/arabinose dehydrogenase